MAASRDPLEEPLALALAFALALPFGLALAYVATWYGPLWMALCGTFGVSVYVLVLGLLALRPQLPQDHHKRRKQERDQQHPDG